MTKSDLIEKVAAQLNLPKGKAELIINCIFDSMEESLKHGHRIEIRGFGSFEIRRYKAYNGRNPRTGDPVGVSPKRLPFFKVGKELKERVNAGGATVRATSKPTKPATASAHPATTATATPTPKATTATPTPKETTTATTPKTPSGPAHPCLSAAEVKPVLAPKAPAVPPSGKKKVSGKR